MSGTQTMETPQFLRNPSSAQVWAHLLRKDSSSSTLVSTSEPSSGILPPLAPLDKNATSMRVLLHDTQAHFEKFSVKVDRLISEVDGAKKEISTVNGLFQREHTVLTEELVDLVNRSQTQIQRSIGEPAQANIAEAILKCLEQRFEALDKRLDALHMFNQTQSQTLQVQSQTLHSIQEQQRTITNILIPLIPLVQAIPLHILSTRNAIKENIEKLINIPDSSKERIQSISPDSCSHKTSLKRSADELPNLKPPKRIRTRSTLQSDNTTNPDCSSSTLMTSSSRATTPRPNASRTGGVPNPSTSLRMAQDFRENGPAIDLRNMRSSTSTPNSTRKTVTPRLQTEKQSAMPRSHQPPSRICSSTPDAASKTNAPLPSISGPSGYQQKTALNSGQKARNSVLPSRMQTPSIMLKTPQAGASVSQSPLTKLFPRNPGTSSSNRDRILPALPPPAPSSCKKAVNKEVTPRAPLRINGALNNGSASSLAPTPLTDKILNTERRHMQRDGRRFIPLIDSDDSDE